jgi:hypothetical protein
MDSETETGAWEGPRRFLTFYPGLHQPGDAKHFERACISIHRLETRRKPIPCADVMIDSGAFTKLAKHGHYPEPVEVYAGQLHRLHTEGVVNITIAATQDYMCEPFMLEKTGLTLLDHQRLTIERFDDLRAALAVAFDGPPPFALMPVLQGSSPEDYVRHLRDYGARIEASAWVGVGSVCKRQGAPGGIEALLRAIKTERPDIRLHGFGVKLTALKNAAVRELLDTADSMAWSFSARKQGRNGNDWREAKAFEQKIRGTS